MCDVVRGNEKQREGGREEGWDLRDIRRERKEGKENERKEGRKEG